MCLMLIIFISASTRTQTRGRERNFLLPDSLQRILGKYNYNPNLPQTFYDSHCQGQHPPLRWRPSDLAMILASIQATRDYSRPPRFSVWHILSALFLCLLMKRKSEVFDIIKHWSNEYSSVNVFDYIWFVSDNFIQNGTSELKSLCPYAFCDCTNFCLFIQKIFKILSICCV